MRAKEFVAENTVTQFPQETATARALAGHWLEIFSDADRPYRNELLAGIQRELKNIGWMISSNPTQGAVLKHMATGRTIPLDRIINENIIESIQAYHGTFQPTLNKFNALSHFGTLKAAEDRLKEKARREKIKDPGRVYEVVLDIENPFVAKDFAGVHSPTHFVFDLKTAKLISQEELEAINRHMGTPKQAELLIKKLRELGFDSIAYKNKYEDKGSTSYVILDPSQVVSVRPLKQKEAVTEAQIPDEIEDFLYDLTPDDVGVEEFGPYRVHYEGFTDDCQSSSDYCADPEAVYQQVFADHIAREGGRRPIEQNFTGDEDYPILYSIFKISRGVKENFADGRVKGKSRPGRVKRSGASCKGSVSSLRSKASKYGGERGRMYHWCANMKSGKKKVNEIITVSGVNKAKRRHLDVLPNDGRIIPPGKESEYMGKKVGDIGQSEVYYYYLAGLHTYVVFDPKDRRGHLVVTGSNYKSNPNSLIIKGVYSGPFNKTRAADLYGWLVQNQGLTLISDLKQSAGGYRVWQELERRYGRAIDVFGFDTKTDEPINITTKDEPETHVDQEHLPSATRDLKHTAKHVRLVASPR